MEPALLYIQSNSGRATINILISYTMALDANNKLQNEAHDPQKHIAARSYVDAAAMQALIDKIGAMRAALVAADNASADNLKTLIEQLRDLINANSAADEAQATEQAEIKAQVETNKTDIADLQDTKADKADLKDWVLATTYEDFLENTFAPFKAEVNEKLDEILVAIQTVVSAADVTAAYDAATADVPRN